MSRLTLPAINQALFYAEIAVRTTDMNYGAHLANDKILTLAHEIRVAFLNQYGFTEKNVAGCGIIMTDAAVVYKSQAVAGDVLLVTLALNDENRYGFDLLYEFKQKNGRLVAQVKTGIVFFDYTQQKVTSIPVGVLDTLKCGQPF
ncbi:MAG: thioesterase family protein [Neisseriaceae bacterium]|nr:thioesterase family protein [Neisseriaceae bacterium]